MKILSIFVATLTLCACSSSPCREVNTSGVPQGILEQQSNKNIFVYKYDGTKQCGQGSEISLENMSKDLRDIKIISMAKRNDGMMRIQVCGAQTGYANVYEISSGDLKKAESYGFKVWNFNN